MRKVELRMNEQEKYDVIKNLVEKNGNKNRAAKKLGITRRQIDRLIVTYKEKGKEGFIHGNRNKKPANSIPDQVSNDIVLLYENKYNIINDDYDAEVNFAHYTELLKREENIKVSYSKVYNTLTKAGISSPKIQKRTKRKRAIEKAKLDKKNKNKTDEEITELVNHQIALEDSHPRKERSKYFGELIEMDASSLTWFGGITTHLHLAIDDATGRIMGGYFDRQETLNGYYNVEFQILSNYGIPYGYLTDNRTVFNYESSKTKRAEKDVLTQFGYACKQLGIELQTTSIPQEKSRIERLNETVQSRLPVEFKIKGISTIAEANQYLIETFIPMFNDKFSLPISSVKSVFETAPSIDKINQTLAVLAPRKIDNGNSIKFKNTYYQPYKNDKMICFQPKTECLVIHTFDDQLLVSIDEEVYELRELKLRKEVSQNIDIEEEKKESKEKKKYIPPMTHPWKVEMFKKQQRQAHLKHQYS